MLDEPAVILITALVVVVVHSWLIVAERTSKRRRTIVAITTAILKFVCLLSAVAGVSISVGVIPANSQTAMALIVSGSLTMAVLVAHAQLEKSRK